MFARFFHCNCTVPPFSYFGRELWRPMGSWSWNYLYQNDSCIFILYFGLCCKIFPALTSGGLLRGSLPCLPDLSLSSCFWAFLTFCHYKLSDSFCSPCFSCSQTISSRSLVLFILEWYLESKIQVSSVLTATVTFFKPNNH